MLSVKLERMTDPMTFAEELEVLCDQASFTMADLAAWCDIDYSAIRSWVRDRVTPQPIRLRYLQKSLKLLRWAIDNEKGIPIPSHILRHDRSQYVKQVRDYARRVSKISASDARV